MAGICIFCGKPITKGRSDKKFCDERCKNDFSNNQKIAEHKEIRRVDLILKNNRRILKKIFLPGKEILISREALLKAGFDFNFHTHHIITAKRNNLFLIC